MKKGVGSLLPTLASFRRAVRRSGGILIRKHRHRVCVRSRRLVDNRRGLTSLIQFDRVGAGRSVATAVLADRRLGAFRDPQADPVAGLPVAIRGGGIALVDADGVARTRLRDDGGITRPAGLVYNDAVLAESGRCGEKRDAG